MTQNNTDIESVLLWFSELESVPLKTRQNFFAHIQEIGGVDAKAAEYLEQVIQAEEARDERKANVLAQKQNLFGSAIAIQENPETSLAQKISDSAVNWIEEKYQDFKTLFDSTQATQRKSEEQSERTFESDQVANLKASLGV